MMKPNKNLVLAAMVFAVAMTFIDQTIVAIAIPSIEKHLSLTGTGAQWVINGYLLSLSALFAFGGKLADVIGRRRVLLIGVAGFTVTSALCGATPTGSIAQLWLIVFRLLQGATGALLFPAAVGIVYSSYPLAERGRAMATFFGISGGLTAVGPILGGVLTQWTWRAIFWVNIPVALIALVLIWRSKPDNERHPGSLDYRGTALIITAMGLIVLGLQQSSTWGWGSIATWAAIVVGLATMAAFVAWELSCPAPLLDLRIFRIRAFAVNNVILAALSAVFIPFFFFASVYSQAALAEKAASAGVYMLYFFVGFASAAQVGGRMLDRGGARRPVLIGCVLGAAGFFLLAGKLTDLSLGSQVIFIILSGAGCGFILGPASTDAVNRARRNSYSEVTGISQTTRNFGASVGIAILGTVLLSRSHTTIARQLEKVGVPARAATRAARSFSLSGASSSGSAHSSPHAMHAVQLAFAQSTQTVFDAMGAILAVTFFIALRFMPRGLAPDSQT
jgi:EmrB/QacA subfamily drug resistance transporter